MIMNVENKTEFVKCGVCFDTGYESVENVIGLEVIMICMCTWEQLPHRDEDKDGFKIHRL